MIPRKLVEIAWQRAWLLVLPVVLAPLAAIALAPSTTEYRSVATVWVSEAPDLGAGSGAGSPGGEQGPASAQAQVLDDLLGTRSFREDVAAAARDLAGEEATIAEEQVRTGVSVSAAGHYLLEIRSTAATPAGAQALNTAVIAEYLTRTGEQAAIEAAARAEIIGARLETASTELERREQQRADYLAANPTATTTGDPAYQSLVSRVVNQAATVDRLTTELNDARLTATAAQLGQQIVFDVQDEPTLPQGPVAPSIADRAMLPLGGLALGLALSAGALLLLYRTDHTIRSGEDLRGLPAPALGRIPELRRGGVRGRALPGGRRDYARRLAASITATPREGS